MTSPPPEWRPERAAGNTLVVLLTILGICCGGPLLCWAGIALFGGLSHLLTSLSGMFRPGN